jgi:drug/metabolite transporter (DMT)-like permease
MPASGLRNISLSPSTLGAIIAATVAALLVSIPEAVAKGLISEYSVFQVAWARYAFLLAAMLLFTTPRRYLWRVCGPRMALQFIRVALQIGCVACFLLALRYMPLGSATAIFFVSPVLITALAIPILGERPNGHCWMAVLLGFVGVLILVAPQAEGDRWAFLLPLGAALMLAFHQIVTRLLSMEVESVATLSCGSLLGAVVTSVPLPFVWVDPGFADWTWMAGVGLIHGVCQYLWLRALGILPASVLAPFMYLEIPAALVLGFLIFDERPETATIIGSLIIVGSGVYSCLSSGKPGAGAGQPRGANSQSSLLP